MFTVSGTGELPGHLLRPEAASSEVRTPSQTALHDVDLLVLQSKHAVCFNLVTAVLGCGPVENNNSVQKALWHPQTATWNLRSEYTRPSMDCERSGEFQVPTIVAHVVARLASPDAV